jgi:hypothetical protein
MLKKIILVSLALGSCAPAGRISQVGPFHVKVIPEADDGLTNRFVDALTQEIDRSPAFTSGIAPQQRYLAIVPNLERYADKVKISSTVEHGIEDGQRENVGDVILYCDDKRLRECARLYLRELETLLRR